ncbi:MAG: isocitrate lyase/phosphoenolpyruvate mutase family protein [Gammaproteobacteria bacterium]|nr:isocitrate lyase/phosphoenolpyruvate mutase family protein [Gammaproteobacteria bacterium]
MTIAKKFSEFAQLHRNNELFVMPNPWDIGSTRIFSQLGFKALATTSGGMAYAIGKPDGQVTREEAIRHCREIAAATSLPVSADLENGYCDAPDAVAELITDVGTTGVAGCSIEDYSGDPQSPIYDSSLAVERIQAAHEARLTFDFDFVLTARCEKFLWNEKDPDAVIKRLQAFESAGADVLFAPGMNDLQDIERLMQSVSKPVNVVMSSPSITFGLDELRELGVRRVSIGSSIAQLVYGKAISAIKELADSGTFNFVHEAMNYEELEAWYR